MAFRILGEAFGAQRHGLIDAYVGTDLGRLADHHPCAVIDEATGPDLRAGMNVDAGLAVRHFRNHARQQRQFQPVQRVRDAVVDQRQHAGVAQHHLVHAARRRVALEGGEHIGVQQLPQARQAVRQFMHRVRCLRIDVGRRGTGTALAVMQLDAGLRQQRMQRAVQRMAHVEILGHMPQLRRPQPQRKQHALERLHRAGHRIARREFAVLGLGAVLLFAPLVAHRAQLANDLGNIEGAHDVAARLSPAPRATHESASR
ncbi:hypothetical protein SDC9_167329 [bioreactor metagenome]|uniref:Uncharacterized protein n=1 Tax=bioreactor metagenome TaxID=1076179 RepID=A0A645G766_9ZZZZ